MRSNTVFIFMLMVILTTGTSSGGERTCYSHSQKFTGLCFSSTNCDSICKAESFETGHCTTFHIHCRCSRACP
ncbi:hypothetical protein RND81_02G028400 [Saponaria officinalis]|uniref:Knottins-like domain-containing protein n=1 Tax=Saponaria officinalis TaxID=3572 RepID=A0AAW1MMB8_SAPOF